jgi:diadenosine tetraphosphatase ApaH/serine/threonine PP2A family protein phosphatase
MKFAAIADIHGNGLALEAVLADIAAQGVAEVVNLGDHLSGPLQARRSADLLIQRNFPSVRGNHDRYLVEMLPAQMGQSDRAAHQQLEPEHLQWLSRLPPTLVYRDEVFLCHGTPESDTTYWLETVTQQGVVHAAPIEEIERAAAGITFPLILCGHTHIPRAVRLRDGRLVVNPGSVGCPGYDDDTPVPHVVQTGTPDASYAILERIDGRWRVNFRHVPYDHRTMAALAAKNGRTEWASALATGWIR